MKPFLTHSGIVVPMLTDNIDTDQIIPSREMKTVSKTGLAVGLFAGQRFKTGRILNPEFVLNQTEFRGASILLAGKNFGCGSSREHAVWALKDYGFRAIIAQSFGEIFYSNCVRNGILPIQMPEDDILNLGRKVTIDLRNQTANSIVFEIDSGDKTMLIDGLDMIGQTLFHKVDINSFFERDKRDNPWKY